MRTATSLLVAAAFLVASLGSAPAGAEGPAVTNVFVVEVEPRNLDAYLESLKEAQRIHKGLGLPGFRVLQATAAGDATGNLAIVVNSENPMIIEREVPGAGRLSSERLQAWRRSPAAFFGTCPTSQWVHSYVTTTRSPVSTSPRTKVRSGSTLCRLRARSLSARSVRRWIQ